MKTIKEKNLMEIKVDRHIRLADKNVEVFFEKNVTAFGTGAKIDCPKEYIGKKAYVVIQRRKKA